MPGRRNDARRPARDAVLAALDEAARAAARARAGDARDTLFRAFLDEFPPAPNYIWGRHTQILACELEMLTVAVEHGRSAYLIVNMPPRHGKSDLASRRWPVWHLLRNPDHEVILATYSAELSEHMARAARRCFLEAGPRYGLRPSEDQFQIGAWGIEGRRGGMYSMGLGGTITGRGAHALVIDDYCKNREEAESGTMRDRVWDSFRNDLMTRLAPVHAVAVVATRWHEDDMVGHIEREMERDAAFPRFRSVVLPALDEAGGRWLFPERFPPSWYEAQRAAVGSYAWEALYMQRPRPRAGRMLRADLARVVGPEEFPPWPGGATKAGAGRVRWARGWDLASSEARAKEDPDYTVGVLAGWDGGTLWIADVVRGRWTALERERAMVETARRDGPGVPVAVEQVAGYKDAVVRLRALLAGKAVVRAETPRADKLALAAALEPLFEAGRVALLRAPWNRALLDEIAAFPAGRHDDQVDALRIAAAAAMGGGRRAALSR
ncbi:MAG: phage terminase large subunit [Planctomycetota bacterium]|nr:phage terminase large subunit [Planctomycetota bacterium]